MQDIIAPQKKDSKKTQIVLLILATILLVLLTSVVTYFLLKKEDPKAENLANELSLDEEDTEGEFVYITAKDGLNMRSGPSTEHGIVYKLPFRAKLKIEDKSQDEKWYKTTFNKISGWFSADYTSREEPEDLTSDWLEDNYQGNISFSLKYPKDWRKIKSDNKNIVFYIKSPEENYDKIYIEILEGKISDYAEKLVDENHSLASKSTFPLGGLSGNKYIIQTLSSGNVIYAEDIILLEKDNFIIKIAGPADNEKGGEVFNLLVWTINFLDKEKNEEI